MYRVLCSADRTKLCTEHVSSLGWENEKLIGIQKDHGELIMYPHRGDTDSQGFFESFMRTIIELVNHTCPPTTNAMFGADDFDDTAATWTIIPELTHAATGLSVQAPGEIARMNIEGDSLSDLRMFRP